MALGRSPVLEDDLSGLIPADTNVGLRSYLSTIWSRRDYIRYTASSELRSQQMNTVLGNLWHILNPLLQILVFYVIFGLILGVTRGVDNLIAFMSVGLFSYQYSTKSITNGARVIIGNRPLLRSVWFPRAMLPITSTFTQLLSFFPMLAVMLFVCIATGEPIRTTWLVIPVILVVQTFFNVGLAMATARAGNHLPDIQQVLPFIFRFLLYGSGVIFIIDEYVERSAFRTLFELNPFFGYVATWRWAVLGYDLEPRVVAYSVVTTCVVLMGGFIWFRRGEQGYTDGT
ncbi:MAG: ABC transporter permease [Ilumatobacter sp.]|jgi:teichoic acid transport system permease protein|uniref:ABC transporter permease n=1 Tax=Ilumatobacter sp. TaxID=1967498 RepID=UPI002A336E18|nr:ABC transporter permease [Ilumatobacter sp.]MBT5865452.1 ABC transporter permease [Ilumatobacter sp.]MDG0977248.1 ABC transporter permease [Ilumatobacter sp.]MDG2232370.1 ABC transporter permease [Ilumatobacter sp.]